MNTNDHQTSDWEHEILHQLDEYAGKYNFPMLDNLYIHNADIRLTVFRSNLEWLMIFQEIAYSERHGFVNDISAYGNKISNAGIQRGLTLASTVFGDSIFDDLGKCALDRYRIELKIRGNVLKLSPSKEDYERAGIHAESSTGSSISECIQILRLLTFLRPEEFFISDKELLDLCGRTDDGLEKFIQLEDWYHPDISSDELPSQSQCFQSLARAIARNDKKLYRCPPELWNTHWTNWETD
jgi:hypothetical protein